MLVLRRMCGQSIAIGENAEIIVKVLRNENGIVNIGVEAPQSVKINRLEIHEKNGKKIRASNDSLASKFLCPS